MVLAVGQPRWKNNLAPPFSTPALIYELDSILERLDLNELFANAQPLEVELGSGDGTFLVRYAAAHPEHNFIGIERLLGRLRKIEKKGRQAGLNNLRAVRIESAYFLKYPDGKVLQKQIRTQARRDYGLMGSTY